MGNIFGTVGGGGTVAAIASTTVHFSNDSGAWLPVAFVLGIILAIFLVESFVDMFDRRRNDVRSSRAPDVEY